MSSEHYLNARPHQRFSQDAGDYIRDQVKHLPSQFIPHVLREFDRREKANGHAAANIHLRSVAEKTKVSSVRLASDDQAIVEKAERDARQCALYIAAGGLFAGRSFAESQGIKLPKKKTEAGEVARLSNSRWWRRQLRKRHGRSVESVALDLNIVNRRADIYSSNASVSRVNSQRTRNRAMLESVYAVNELGQGYSLAELADLSVSNPTIRRGELMTRIAGMEMQAVFAGHVGEFWTITCPSKMHSALSVSGERNPKYDGTTPREAQKYLCKQWAKTRAALKREDIELYGFRVCEPQHDGTPHWHTLFFMPEHQRDRAREIVKKYALQVDGSEPGADKYRFKPVAIDWNKGSAAGYIAKYIAKNIDAFGVDVDLYGKDANKSIERVAAWASTWGIRQFQQIGGASVTVWRELRRMKADQTEGAHIDKHREAADVGDWFAYSEQQKRARVSLFKVWNDKPGAYVEPLGWQIVGVSLSGFDYITKVHEWRIENEKTGDSREVAYMSDSVGRVQNRNGYKCAVKRGGCGNRAGRSEGGSIADGFGFSALRGIGHINFFDRDKAETIEKACNCWHWPMVWLLVLTWSPVNNCTHNTSDQVSAGIENNKKRRKPGGLIWH